MQTVIGRIRMYHPAQKPATGKPEKSLLWNIKMSNCLVQLFNNLTNEKEKEKPNNHPQGIATSSRALPLAKSCGHLSLKLSWSWNSKVGLFLTWSSDQVPSTLSHSGLSLWCVTKSGNPIRHKGCRNSGLWVELKRLRCKGLYVVTSLPLSGFLIQISWQHPK